ncbi:MAG: NAD(P)/FAD-dependent oxidoreductase [Planctomycetes bacterium]|nr:NAD(P)/FAD-dependent oxidoreductase [Planctomycetota bacterium]
MSNSYNTCQYAIVGAGPYGLAVASHLRAAGFDVRIFGKAMDFWHSQMPKGMKLRSPLEGSHISDPEGAFSIDRFGGAEGRVLEKSLPLEDFVAYGQWFQRAVVPDLDSRNVAGIERTGEGFRLTLDDEDRVYAQAVVIAAGIGSFANRPAPFDALPSELASHTSDRSNRDLGRFAGERVVVVGSGQSALESAALLHEAGIDVEVLVRQPQIRYLKDSGFLEWLMDLRINPFRAPGKIGPIGINWLIEHPALFTLFPRAMQDWMTRRALRPAGSSWLRPRHEGIAFRTNCHAVAASAHGERARLTLNDGTTIDADHVLLGTGYKIDIARYDFLSADVLQSVQTVNGYPVLDGGFESSVPGLHFVGTTAAYSFGPLCRFVAGTPYAAHTLTKHARRKPAPRRRAEQAASVR